MARGADSKLQITNRILSTFDGAFLYNDGKEIRIPLTENGEEVQIKVTLTCAKDNVIPGGDKVLPGEAVQKDENVSYNFTTQPVSAETKVVEPTAEEKENVKSLLAALGL